jgi:hypothetical protein
MRNEEIHSVEELANFKFSATKQAHLPIREAEGYALSDERKEAHRGYYSAVIPVESKNSEGQPVKTVLKLNTLLGYNLNETPVVRKEDKPVMVKKSEEEDKQKEDTHKVEVALRELAKEKKQTYELLSTYIGKFLPKLHGMAIVESPRREIERRFNNLSPEAMRKVPTHEITLMEQWEDIDANNALFGKKSAEIAEIYQKSEFKETTQEFATEALQLFLKEGIALDIVDAGGIRSTPKPSEVDATKPAKETITALDEDSDITTEHDTNPITTTKAEAGIRNAIALINETSNTLPVPRNIAYDSNTGRLAFYDTYPVYDLGIDYVDFTRRAFLAIKDGDTEALSKLIDTKQDSVETETQMFIINYMTILKYFGAEFKY